MAIRKSLNTTLRVTSDIWLREGVVQLFPSSALRVIDHQLHASGIIPLISDNHNNNNHMRMYEHDWYCASQAVTCYPLKDLLHRSLEEGSTQCHSWVLSVGNSSIRFGNVLTLDDHVLATAQRVFIRKQIDGTSAPFSDTERDRFLSKDCTSTRLNDDPDNINHQHALTLPVPMFEKFGMCVPNQIHSNHHHHHPLLKVTIGPTHANFANHADHAFLAETAVHALHLANKLPVAPSSNMSVAIQYLSEVLVGHVLECILHGDRVFMVRTLADGTTVLVLVAEASCSST